MTFAIINIETVYQGWGRYLIASIRLPDGETIRREIEDHGRAVCVLPYDPERRTVVLVRLLRAPVFLTAGQESSLEAIAGLLEEDDPAACARREAHEEAGLSLGALEHVVTGWSMPGISTERMDLYLAEYRAADCIGFLRVQMAELFIRRGGCPLDQPERLDESARHPHAAHRKVLHGALRLRAPIRVLRHANLPHRVLLDPPFAHRMPPRTTKPV